MTTARIRSTRSDPLHPGRTPSSWRPVSPAHLRSSRSGSAWCWPSCCVARSSLGCSAGLAVRRRAVGAVARRPARRAVGRDRRSVRSWGYAERDRRPAGPPRPAGPAAVDRAVRADAVRRRQRRPARTRVRPGHGGHCTPRPPASDAASPAWRRRRPPGCATGSPRSARPARRACDRGRTAGARAARGPEPAAMAARLHPLTPLLKGAKMLAVAVAAISWQGYAQLGFLRWLLVVAAILVVDAGAVGGELAGDRLRGRRPRTADLRGADLAADPVDPAGTGAGDRRQPAAAGPAHRPGRAAAGGDRRGQDRGAAGVPDRRRGRRPAPAAARARVGRTRRRTRASPPTRAAARRDSRSTPSTTGTC